MGLYITMESLTSLTSEEDFGKKSKRRIKFYLNIILAVKTASIIVSADNDWIIERTFYF